MYKALLLLFLAAAYCQNADNRDWDSIISQIFGKEPNKNDKSGGQTVATQTPVNKPSNIVPPTTSNPTVYQDMSCTRTDGSIGECVSESLCNKPDNIIYEIDGIDLHFVYTPCDNEDTCCRVEDKRPVQTPVKRMTEPKVQQ